MKTPHVGSFGNDRADQISGKNVDVNMMPNLWDALQEFKLVSSNGQHRGSQADQTGRSAAISSQRAIAQRRSAKSPASAHSKTCCRPMRS